MKSGFLRLFSVIRFISNQISKAFLVVRKGKVQFIILTFRCREKLLDLAISAIPLRLF